MEEIKIGQLDSETMPPEPPQKRAEELEGYVEPTSKRKSKSGFSDLKQPTAKKKEPKKEVLIVSPEQAFAEAQKPRVDRPVVMREGKIARKVPKGSAKPL